MGKKIGKPCYFCGEKSTTTEHVPPRQMFQGFLCDSITVPSCQLHNGKKSGTDEAVIKAHLIQLNLHRDGLKDSVLNAIDAARNHFVQVEQSVGLDSFVPEDPNPIFSDQNVYLKSHVDVSKWITQLTAALVWDALQHFDSDISWNDAATYSPGHLTTYKPFANSAEAISAIEQNQETHNLAQSLPWIEGWSASQRKYPADIYHFEIIPMDEEMVFRHTLYGLFSWYVFFAASTSTINQIISKALHPSNPPLRDDAPRH